MQRPNFTLWTGAQATGLQLQRDGDGVLRCQGVELVKDGRRLTAIARRELILSAGAIGSVQILELSGIGDGARLAAAGVTPGDAVTVKSIAPAETFHVPLPELWRPMTAKPVPLVEASWSEMNFPVMPAEKSKTLQIAVW